MLRQGSPRALIFVEFASVFSQKYVSMGLQREYLGSTICENNVDLAVGYQVDIELLFFQVLYGWRSEEYAAHIRDF